MRTIAVLLSLGALVAPVSRSAEGSPSNGQIVDVPVTFSVVNSNRSGVPCLSDGEDYVVQGRLVAPVAALAESPAAVTLYLHSPVLASHVMWRFDAVPGYDHAREMAELGHASVTIDRLGYGDSDIPPGAQTCIGSAADVAHQVVQKLRSGDYVSPETPAVSFGRVALAGLSGGGATAEVVAYSFSGIDALINIGWGESGHAPGFAAAAATDIYPCAAGGEPKHEGSASGYVQLFTQEAAFNEWIIANAEPDVANAGFQARERDPCGDLGSVGQVIAISSLRVSEIEVPVLLVFGELDAVYAGSAPADHRARFTGSDDVTLLRPAGAGHVVTLSRTAPEFRSALSDWLSARGF